MFRIWMQIPMLTNKTATKPEQHRTNDK